MKILPRETKQAATAYGDVGVKLSRGEGFERCKAEYEDLARLARENGVSILDVIASVEK